jgi:hypothetical protein
VDEPADYTLIILKIGALPWGDKNSKKAVAPKQR